MYNIPLTFQKRVTDRHDLPYWVVIEILLRSSAGQADRSANDHKNTRLCAPNSSRDPLGILICPAIIEYPHSDMQSQELM